MEVSDWLPKVMSEILEKMNWKYYSLLFMNLILWISNVEHAEQ